jgi:serine/threonine-protein kinase SRPK3
MLSPVHQSLQVSFPEQESEYESSESEDEQDYKTGTSRVWRTCMMYITTHKTWLIFKLLHRCLPYSGCFTKGGYHPVQIGDTFSDGRYRVLQKLGWGHFSTVWLCFDKVEKQHCAVKVQKADPHYADAARDEIRLLNALHVSPLSRNIPVVALLDSFEHKGPNGLHVCLTFEVLSKSLLSLIKRFNYRGVPMALIKIIARQVLEGLEYSHEQCKIIHTDLKPENILFAKHESEREMLQQLALRAVGEMEKRQQAREERRKLREKQMASNPSSEDPDTSSDDENLSLNALGTNYRPNMDLAFESGRVKIVDFGNACWEDKPFTDDIQTRQYRAPEVILGAGYNSKADIWSLACLIFELTTGDFLFDPHSGKDYDRDEDHLALMMELLGPLPMELINKGMFAGEFYTKKGELKHIKRLNFWSLRDVLREKYKVPPHQAEEMSSFLLPMLYYDPARRISAREALRHSFVNGPETLAWSGRGDNVSAALFGTNGGGEAFERLDLKAVPERKRSESSFRDEERP